ncbi:MAG: hypothetical protein GY940_41455 [bacterium]|nr:hypothetical protein [bacterium]
MGKIMKSKSCLVKFVIAMALVAMTGINFRLQGEERARVDSQSQVILLKADDVLPSPEWKRFTKYIEDHNLKAGIGLVCTNLYDERLSNWLKSLVPKGNFEIWNHGYAHNCGDANTSTPGEYIRSPYEEQLYYLTQSQKIFKDILGVTCRVFGTPCNYKDVNTFRALADVAEVDIWYYGWPDSIKMNMRRRGEIEWPTGNPNYDYFVEKYADDNLAQYPVLVLQIHPGWWEDARWTEFERVLAFLDEKNAVFMNPSEYYQSVTDTFTVTTTANSGTGSLRDAIQQANGNLEKNAVIELPAGTYNLTGTTNEDNNLGGDLDIDSNIIIRGAGYSSTFIDGGGSDRVFHILDGRVTISGVTVRNGRADYGGGIYAQKGNFAVQHCTVSGNTVAPSGTGTQCGGGGIYVELATLTLTDSNISNNSGTASGSACGGGVWINTIGRRFADIRNCLFSGNIANTHSSGSGQGGGLYLNAPLVRYESDIFNNTFRANRAASGGKGEGGAVYILEVEKARLTRNRFENNTASENNNGSGGGIAVEGEATLTLAGNLLTGNIAAIAGSGIFLNVPSGSTRITCTLLNNTLAHNLEKSNGTIGEAVYMGRNVTLNMTNNIVSGHAVGIDNGDSGSTVFQGDSNLFYNTTDSVTGTNALLIDPFLDAAYKLPANSPAVDAGKTLTDVIKDLSGTVLPLGSGYDMGCFETPPSGNSPGFNLDRTTLNFVRNGLHPPGQKLRVTQTGAGTVHWTVGLTRNWLKASPVSGSKNGEITISVKTDGLPEGLNTGTVIISDPNNPGNSQEVNINLTIATSPLPFGSFDSPLHGTTGVSGSIPVTGWALDETKLAGVQIFNEPMAGQPMHYIGDAIFVEGARVDVEQLYPDYPDYTRAGWGYMLLTNMLPGGGNGIYNLYAQITDTHGNTTMYGPRTITVDNLNAVKPFGAIDTPTQGGTASGAQFINFGWALTPQPNIINTDGSTIHVWVNGVKLGNPAYNKFRQDIASFFPGYRNSDGAIGVFYLDTTAYENDVHTIQWTVTDDVGNTDGIGSRYFRVQNNDADSHSGSTFNHFSRGPGSMLQPDRTQMLIDRINGVKVKTGFATDSNSEPRWIHPDGNGILHVEIKNTERFELQFFPGGTVPGVEIINLSPLPVGSTLNAETGTFYWQPGPVFRGRFSLSFAVKTKENRVYKKTIIVTIQPESLPVQATARKTF